MAKKTKKDIKERHLSSFITIMHALTIISPLLIKSRVRRVG